MTENSRFFPYSVSLLVAAALVFRIGAALHAAGGTELTVWGDRDLWRALSFGAETLGPEINGGARPPGGAFYLLLGIILSVRPGIMAAEIGLMALFAASALLLWGVFAREASPRAGALIAASFAGSAALGPVLTIWNPGYALFFATAATVCGYLYVKTGRAWTLGLTGAALAFGAQIHMQVFQIALGLAIALAVYRRRPVGRDLLALLAGLAIPYLPSLAAAGGHLFGTAAAVPQGAAENYLFAEFHPLDKAGLVYGVLGGDLGLVLAPFFGGEAPWRWLAALADLAAVLLAAAFLLRAAGRRLRPTDGRPFGVLVIIAAIYLAVALVSAVNLRHMVAAAPAVAIVTGLAADRLIGRLAGHPSRSLAAAAPALAVLLALRPLTIGVVQLDGRVFSPHSVTAQAEIAAVAKAQLYADVEAFDDHAALFRRNAMGAWQLDDEGISGQMSFIYRTTPVAELVRSDRNDCLAVLPKDDDAGGPGLAGSRAFSGLAPSFGPKVAESRHFTYYSYRLPDGNCLKSFPNAYLPSAFEAAHLVPGAATPSSTADAAAFPAPLPGRAFPYGIELRRTGSATSDGGFTATLHGRLLRGYTGLDFDSVIDPLLCLAGDAGTRVIPLARVTVGSPQRGTLAPWHSLPFPLKDGRYRLWLTGRDGKRPLALHIPLGGLSLPDMTVTPPRPDEPVPPGCPVPMIARAAGGIESPQGDSSLRSE